MTKAVLLVLAFIFQGFGMHEGIGQLFTLQQGHHHMPLASMANLVSGHHQLHMQTYRQHESGRRLLIFSEDNNNGTCTQCPPGSYSSAFRESCISCPVGTAQPLPSSEKCYPCPRGYYSGSQPGSVLCSKCSAGKYAGLSLGYILDVYNLPRNYWLYLKTMHFQA